MSATGVAADEDILELPETVGVWPRFREWASGLRPAWKALIAYLLYQGLAFWIWVVPVLRVFGQEHLGTGLQDSRYYQWALAWTPWALAHGIDPLHTSFVFAPTGVSLAWSAFVPGPALVAWPITAAFGPLASLNVLLAVAPALAAWAAYLVCHRLTHRFWASLAGGCLFGFSAYVSSNMNGWLNLLLIFPIPLLLYLVIRRVEGSLGPVAFVAWFAVTLIGLFSISTELFGTAAVFGAIAFAGALAFGTQIRRSLLRTGSLVLIAGAIAALALAPYIHAIFVDAPDQPVRQADLASPDVASLVIPPPVIRAGGSASWPILNRLLQFPRSNGEAYVGVAALAMVVAFAVTEWRRRVTWLLVGSVVICLVLTLGPVLHIGARASIGLPERTFSALPFMDSAIPARMALYADLEIGIIAAVWLAWGRGRSARIRWVVVGLVFVSLVPYAPHHAGPVQVPGFFSSDQVDSHIGDGENVYVIPADKGSEMLWQAISGFRFKLAQGYIGPIPPQLDTGRMAQGLHLRKVPDPPTAEEFAAWTRERGVTAVILDDRARDRFLTTVEAAGMTQVFQGGGVSIWRWPDAPTGLG